MDSVQLLRFNEQLHTANSELAADWLHGYLHHHGEKMAAQVLFIQTNFLSSHTRFLHAFQRHLAIAQRTSPPAVFIKSLSSPLCTAMIVSADPMACALHVAGWIHSGAYKDTNVSKLCMQCSCLKTALHIFVAVPCDVLRLKF